MTKVIFATNYIETDGQFLGLLGSLPEVGEWQPQNCVLAEKKEGGDRWIAAVVLPVGAQLEWKWGVLRYHRYPIVYVHHTSVLCCFSCLLVYLQG